MKIVFFGTPEPAAQILQKIIATEHRVLAVVTQPDRPCGRGQKVTFPPVKESALKNQLTVLQPDNVRVTEFHSIIGAMKPEIAVVVAYGKILPQELLAIPKFGFINLHASLLPKYRGAAPIQWALLNGEKETGMTVFRLTEKLDDGSIITQKKVRIKDDDDATTLSKRLFSAGEKILLEALDRIEKGEAEFRAQDETQVTYAPLLTRESGALDWRKSAPEIKNRIRALKPWPTAYTFYHGKRLKIFKAEDRVLDLALEKNLPGTIIHVLKGEGFIVATGHGDLLITEVQPEAGKKMKASDYALGHDVKSGEVLPS